MKKAGALGPSRLATGAGPQPCWRLIIIGAVFAVGLAAFPALAFDTNKLGQEGSLGLDDLAKLIAKVPKLKSEVDDALAKTKKKPEEIRCSGMRFPGRWVHLGGLRVAPYVCDFGSNKWLDVRAKVRVLGRKDRAFPTITSAAMKEARAVEETSVTWLWLDHEPRR